MPEGTDLGPATTARQEATLFDGAARADALIEFVKRPLKRVIRREGRANASLLQFAAITQLQACYREDSGGGYGGPAIQGSNREIPDTSQRP
jgi:hypothetical protein